MEDGRTARPSVVGGRETSDSHPTITITHKPPPLYIGKRLGYSPVKDLSTIIMISVPGESVVSRGSASSPNSWVSGVGTEQTATLGALFRHDILIRRK